MAQEKYTYDFAAIERKWQAYWAEHRTFRTPNPGDCDFDATRPKFYVLDMFPYPSGAGLHVGHPEGYTATDIYCRFKRHCGFNVLHPMGYDAFGLPAEQYAIETGVHPAETTRRNIENIRRQIKSFGFCYDWDRELATTDVDYYRWTQWIFKQMFESWYDPRAEGAEESGRPYRGKARPIGDLIAELESGTLLVTEELGVAPAAEKSGQRGPLRRWSELDAGARRRVIDGQRLAYLDEVPVNWCPALGTVLANEEVTNEGRSERGNHPVYRRPLRQWMLRITKYADRLERDLDALNWPEPIKLMQRNWIGRSEGAEVVFPLADKWKIEDGRWRSLAGEDETRLSHSAHVIHVYTTRPDTLFGATYMVLAPEHPFVEQITTSEQRKKVREYVAAAAQKTDLDRSADTKEKTGVFTGAYAINPVTGQRIPIWVADYVLLSYGTGAIMAVPAGDTRDFEFAKKFGLPIRAVVRPPAVWIRDQLIKLGLDREQATKSRRSDLLESTEHSIDVEDTTTVQEVAVPLYEDHPDLFFEAYTGDGTAIHSPDAKVAASGMPTCDINRLRTPEAKKKIVAWLAERELGRAAVNYKLRDWLFSRQRYWGEPFPILHGPGGEVVAVGDDELPVRLPEMTDFRPQACDSNDAVPEPPLARAAEWATVQRPGPDGQMQAWRRELNTMPQWAGSCWYYLRYISPRDEQHFVDPQAERYWMPIDLYMGGAEHAVLHLLYARFWHKFLYDRGHVSTVEPFRRLYNQGMIRSFAYQDERGVYIHYDEIEFHDDALTGRSIPRHKKDGEVLRESIEKMSKSLKNVVNPDQVIAEFGADTMRLYEMYMGPLDATKPWNTRDVPGLHRFLHRVWRLVVDEETGALSGQLQDVEPDEETRRLLHKTIKRVTEETDAIKFNTAIAEMFKFVNALTKVAVRPRSAMATFLVLLEPYAPHLAEELWQRLHGPAWRGSLAHEPWPAYDPALVREEEVEVAIQLNGKVKSRIRISVDASEDEMREAALAEEKVRKELAGRTLRFVKCVPGRLVNIVAS